MQDYIRTLRMLNSTGTSYGLPTGQFTKDTFGYGRGSLTGSAVTVLAVALRSIRLSIMTSKGA